jgi:hypothetical protein
VTSSAQIPLGRLNFFRPSGNGFDASVKRAALAFSAVIYISESPHVFRGVALHLSSITGSVGESQCSPQRQELRHLLLKIS